MGYGVEPGIDIDVQGIPENVHFSLYESAEKFFTQDRLKLLAAKTELLLGVDQTELLEFWQSMQTIYAEAVTETLHSYSQPFFVIGLFAMLSTAHPDYRFNLSIGDEMPYYMAEKALQNGNL